MCAVSMRNSWRKKIMWNEYSFDGGIDSSLACPTRGRHACAAANQATVRKLLHCAAGFGDHLWCLKSKHSNACFGCHIDVTGQKNSIFHGWLLR